MATQLCVLSYHTLWDLVEFYHYFVSEDLRRNISEDIHVTIV
jgi:hypothetical protein